jgi:hypothetical protein
MTDDDKDNSRQRVAQGSEPLWVGRGYLLQSQSFEGRERQVGKNCSGSGDNEVQHLIPTSPGLWVRIQNNGNKASSTTTPKGYQ